MNYQMIPVDTGFLIPSFDNFGSSMDYNIEYSFNQLWIPRVTKSTKDYYSAVIHEIKIKQSIGRFVPKTRSIEINNINN